MSEVLRHVRVRTHVRVRNYEFVQNFVRFGQGLGHELMSELVSVRILSVFGFFGPFPIEIGRDWSISFLSHKKRLDVFVYFTTLNLRLKSAA